MSEMYEPLTVVEALFRAMPRFCPRSGSPDRTWRDGRDDVAGAGGGSVAEGQMFGRRDVPLQDRFDLPQRVLVVAGGVRHDAVGGREDLQPAHVGVVGGEQ